jgi:hypothetical protein
MNFYATTLLNFAVYVYKLVIMNNVSQCNCKLGIIHVFQLVYHSEIVERVLLHAITFGCA